MLPRRNQRARKLSEKAMANQTATAAATEAKIAKAAKAANKPAANSSAKMASKTAKATVKAEPSITATKPAPKKVAAKAAPPKAAVPKAAVPKAAAPKRKAEPKPAIASKKEAEPAPPASKKRKADIKTEDPIEEQDDAAPPAKKIRVAAAPKNVKAAPAVKKPKAAAAPKKSKLGLAINEIPTQKLDIYVFGEGSAGELGLGSVKVDGKKPIDVKRPRLNHNLSADTVGVVHVAVGGMHSAALTYDNKILTWGVNDSGALGRETTWAGGLKDMDDNMSNTDSDDDEDSKMNPMESTPMAVDSKYFPEDTKFVQLVASDNATFVLTADGSVYGWGTFRSNDGVLGFTEKVHTQFTPMQIPQLKKITSIAAGSNHILALDHKGNVFAWGSGQQNQLGRRVVERTRLAGLVPREFGLPKQKITYISCGAYHSFAMTKDGKVYAWGLNNFGETGITDGAGEDNAVIFKPMVITELKDYKIKEIKGGGHHSLACTTDGQLLVWGRADGSQIGIKLSDLPKEDLVHDERGAARILQKPTVIPGIRAISVAAGSDNSFAIDADGKAWSWGFSANYQTGLGGDDDVEVATLVENSAVKGKKLCGAGAGGQFGMLWGCHE